MRRICGEWIGYTGVKDVYQENDVGNARQQLHLGEETFSSAF
jgi:hypothetical protein